MYFVEDWLLNGLRNFRETDFAMRERKKERTNDSISIYSITCWKPFHLFTVTKYIFRYSLTGAEISVMASPTGQIQTVLVLVCGY